MSSEAITTDTDHRLLIFSITCHSLSLNRPELRTLAKVDLAVRLRDSWRVRRGSSVLEQAWTLASRSVFVFFPFSRVPGWFRGVLSC
jgi:hypothetical protein